MVSGEQAISMKGKKIKECIAAVSPARYKKG